MANLPMKLLVSILVCNYLNGGSRVFPQ